MIEAKRLLFRKLDNDDFADLCEMLQDVDVMYAWEQYIKRYNNKDMLHSIYVLEK